MVDVFSLIANLYQQGNGTDEVSEALQREIPQTIDASSQEDHQLSTTSSPSSTRALFEAQSTALQHIASALDRFSNQEKVVIELKDEVRQLRSELNETIAARDEAERKTQLALDNAVETKKQVSRTREDINKKVEEITNRESEVRETLKRLEDEQRKQTRPWWAFWRR